MKHAITSMLLLLCFVISCRKKVPEPIEEIPVTTASASKTNIQSMFNQLSTPVETFTVDMAVGAYYTCHNKTRLYIAPHSFLNRDRSVTEGVVIIQTKDLRSKKDMILNNAFPVSGGKLMVSEGALYFDVKQNGKRLIPNPDHHSTIFVPFTGAYKNRMELFCAGRLYGLSNTGINWIQNNSSVIPFSISGIFTDSYSYNISDANATVSPVDSIGWFNCAYFYNSPGFDTRCTVRTTGISDKSNTVVFISVDGIETVARLYPGSASEFISADHALPVGASCTVGAICFDGTNYHYVSKQVIVVDDMIIDLPPLTKSSKTRIEINLNDLR